MVGYATVDGRRVAISAKRSSYGKDTLDLLFNRRISNGYVKSPKTFFKAASKTPQTFNSFYIDHEHVAEYTSGRLPLRARGVDPGLPTVGNGKYEWRGYLPMRKHPHGVDPEGRDDDQLERVGRAASSAPPTTSGAATARWAGSTCSTRTSPA